MNAPKLSTRSYFESSLLLRSLAEDFEKNRDMQTFTRLLMVLSATANWAALDVLCAYLKDTAGTSIMADWDKYVPRVKVKTDLPF